MEKWKSLPTLRSSPPVEVGVSAPELGYLKEVKILDEIDEREFWKDDARDDPDPRDKPFFSTWTISGRMTQSGWEELEEFLDNFGLTVENIEDSL